MGPTGHCFGAALIGGVTLSNGAANNSVYSVYPEGDKSLVMADGTVIFFEYGIADVAYNVVYDGKAEHAYAVLSVNGKDLAVTRRELQNGAGVGATCLLTVNAGDRITVRVVDGRDSAEVELYVKYSQLKQE